MDTNFFNVLDSTTKIDEQKETHIDFSMQERAIIGNVVMQAISNALIEIDFLSASHFQNQFYGILYEYCLNGKKNNEIVTLANIQHDLLDSDVDSSTFINELIRGTSRLSQGLITNYAYSIDEYYKTLRIRDETNSLFDSLKSYSRFANVKKTLQNFVEITSKLTYSPLAQKTVFTHDEAIADFESEFFSKSNQRILTGLKPLDDIIGGFGRGEFIVGASRPGMGKTALAIHLEAHIAECGFNCLTFNFEMSNSQNTARFISRDTYIENNTLSIAYNKFMKKEGSEEQFRNAFEIAKARQKNITHNYGNLSIDEIISFATQHAHSLARENKQLDFIVIDYLQIIKMQNKRDAHLEIGEITGKLKQLAKLLNCAVFCLSQLNRAIESNVDKRPVLQHLRQSGKIEEDADIVLFPYRPSYYERDTDETQREWREDYLEIIVEKNRVGNKGIAKIKVNMAVNYFESGNFNQKDEKAGMTPNGMTNPKKEKRY